jgi:hypothetical protein
MTTGERLTERLSHGHDDHDAPVAGGGSALHRFPAYDRTVARFRKKAVRVRGNQERKVKRWSVGERVAA